MDKELLRQIVGDCLNKTENMISAEQALAPRAAGRPLFREPLLRVASAQDPLFASYKSAEIIGPHYLMPEEWLSGAKSVISIFLPYDAVWHECPGEALPPPAGEHLYGPEGKEILAVIAQALISALTAAGGRAIAPCYSEHYWYRASYEEAAEHNFTSNWSERHIAYAAGLGTFSLNRGLITAAGMAGRLLSVVTDLPFEADTRPYAGRSDYCTGCGACIARCPSGAIGMAGKEQRPCADWLDRIRPVYHAEHNCSKCQTETLCAQGLPS